MTEQKINSTPRTRKSRKRKDDLAQLGIIYAGYFEAIKKEIPKDIRKKIVPFMTQDHLETLEYYDSKVKEVANNV